MNILLHRFFQVIVIRYGLDYTGVVNSPESFTPKDLMTYEEAHKSPVPAAYVTFQFRGQDFDVFRILLLEMEEIQAVNQEIGEAVMRRSFLTNHSSQIPFTECFSELL